MLTSSLKYSEEQYQEIVVLSKDSDMDGYDCGQLVNEDCGRYVSCKVTVGECWEERVWSLCDEKATLIVILPIR